MATPRVENDHILTVKCVVVGDERIGKSCFIARLSGHSFHSQYCPTMVNLTSVRTMREGHLMLIDCWDTPGAHHLQNIRRLTYQGTHIFAVCFSVVIPESFESVHTKWMKEIRELGPPDAFVILIGLQADLRGDEEVNRRLHEEGLQGPTPDACAALAESIGALKYFECSSKMQTGFCDVIEKLTTVIPNPTRIIRHVSVSHSSRGTITDADIHKKLRKSIPRTSET
ncbi:Rho-related GTP-binding protein RhoG [Taenia crassiceps]|uniref:Rho-related GTP-binding protein RhoG n=1 Tax=Taenia crassiceps TaxID=6207 RepID=A0ABR4Q548_9CEST